MRGSVKKEGSTWYYVIDLGRDEQGKRKRKKQRGFKNKADAEKALTQILNELDRGTFIEPTKMLYGDFLEEWLRNKQKSVKKQSFTNYVSIKEAYLLPEFGSIPIQKLNAFMLQRFVNSLCDKGLTHAYIKKITDILNSSLKRAQRLDIIQKNPMELVEKPRIAKKEMKVWDIAETEKFLRSAKPERVYIAFLLAITTGMRQGEILGLRWKDINFDKSSLCISQTLSHDGKELISEAKTKSSIRSIHLPNETIEELKRHRSLIIKEKLLSGEEYKDHDLVVCTSVGTPMIPRNLTKIWKRLTSQARVSSIRFHDLRHTHATLLLSQGIHIKVVSERLGHNDTRMTLDTYSHLLPSMQAEASKAIDQALFKR
ncbi:site-specific integrase [Brevibacillus choshinensis]|uniref:site-specific integrase n=1 Tax=Brevibacillus choshinensis TaxID=54911 RepID=UPI002E1E4491|nr:site-specific integrase [Brevibacillus choshinensis]